MVERTRRAAALAAGALLDVTGLAAYRAWRRALPPPRPAAPARSAFRRAAACFAPLPGRRG